jgi:hypothetical protein
MNNQEEFKEFIRIETLDYLVGINLHKVMDRHCACIRRKLLIPMPRYNYYSLVGRELLELKKEHEIYYFFANWSMKKLQNDDYLLLTPPGNSS